MWTLFVVTNTENKSWPGSLVQRGRERKREKERERERHTHTHTPTLAHGRRQNVNPKLFDFDHVFGQPFLFSSVIRSSIRLLSLTFCHRCDEQHPKGVKFWTSLRYRVGSSAMQNSRVMMCAYSGLVASCCCTGIRSTGQSWKTDALALAFSGQTFAKHSRNTRKHSECVRANSAQEQRNRKIACSARSPIV